MSRRHPTGAVCLPSPRSSHPIIPDGRSDVENGKGVSVWAKGQEERASITETVAILTYQASAREVVNNDRTYPRDAFRVHVPRVGAQYFST